MTKKRKRQIQQKKRKAFVLEMKQTMETLAYETETQMKELCSVMKEQEKCLSRFYDEYEYLKKYRKEEKEEVKEFFELRNCMYRSMMSAESNEMTEMMNTYIRQMDYLLKKKGVKILEAHEMEEYDPEIHMPATLESRVSTGCAQKHNKIAQVYGCGYWFYGDPKPREKVPVDVYIYEGVQEYRE